MSGHSALVAGDSENLGGVGLTDRGATAGFCPGPALGPSSLRWIRGLLPGEARTGWWAEVTSCLAETPDPAIDANTCAATADRYRSWSGPAGRPRFVAWCRRQWVLSTAVSTGRGQNVDS
jgi:hypothetical protein